MVSRNDVIENLIETLDEVIDSIEEQEVDDSDFHHVRQLAENLRDELDSLYQF